MAEPQRLVVDTNVVFKWHVTERESHLAPAQTLLEDFLRGFVDLLAPDILRYELSNLLRVAVQQGRLSEDRARRAYSGFEASGIVLASTSALVQEGLDLALRHRISIFDALFLLVGLRSNTPLVTDDERLATAGAAAGCAVIRLADYQSASG